MRLFQNGGLYPKYRQRLDCLAKSATTFSQRLDIFLNDRYGACHILLPVLEMDPVAFFTNGDDEILQYQWAREQGMSGYPTLEYILLAQIEHHRTEVFYNFDPMRYSSDFIKKLPGCVKASIAWRAAPSPRADFASYDLIICNFPNIIESYRQNGWTAAYFSPAHDPEMDAYATNTDRPIDVLFIGSYSRHHRRRAIILESVAAQASNFNVVMHLDCSRVTRIAELPIVKMLPFAKNYRRPDVVARIAHPPVYGRDLYKVLSRSKIVLNGAIDMAGDDRGNMRCFEAMGCGTSLLSDSGNYPSGMIDGKTMRTYSNSVDIIACMQEFLRDFTWQTISKRGYCMVRKIYSKQLQWEAFKTIVGTLR